MNVVFMERTYVMKKMIRKEKKLNLDWLVGIRHLKRRL